MITTVRLISPLVLGMAIAIMPATGVFAQESEEPIPHAQSKRPNKALSPAEAMARMKLPKGFKVELVASEPNLLNPVAMTFDERGRIWVTESLEYPRAEPGKGRDRIKILEDTDGDGKADKFTIFAEGLNIPSGIAVGHGGVWVANSPDILFLKDTNHDDKADEQEVIVTGFGRDDTHELPNSLTWGPDGWLYGWNGVFNRSVVNYRGKTYDFTCAIFRIHPKTRDFELFCEGTSNPWGITFDPEGSAFASACVIDHLWHLTETGYYHRQGGPYPPHIWKIESIVDHKHQQAAYCGIHYFDSEAFPAEYRDRLYLGNVHAGSINVDMLNRKGATYVSSAAPDFLRANDAWFMPVSQKTGPDGNLYVLDWYDRYHCYQDAKRDSEGIDRLKGRLYRIRHEATPPAAPFDFQSATEKQLIDTLADTNIHHREMAERLLTERGGDTATEPLQAMVMDTNVSRKGRLFALWTLIARGPLDPSFHKTILTHDDPTFRAWGVRAAGNQKKVASELTESLKGLWNDPSADVRLQLAIASRKVDGLDALTILTQILRNPKQDLLISKIVWRNLEPLLEDREGAARWLGLLSRCKLSDEPALVEILPRVTARLLSRPNPEDVPIATIADLLIQAETEPSLDAAGEVLWIIGDRIRTGEIRAGALDVIKNQFAAIYEPIIKQRMPRAVFGGATILAATLKDPEGMKIARANASNVKLDHETRFDAMSALIAAGDAGPLDEIDQVLGDPEIKDENFRADVLNLLGRVDQERVADIVLKHYPAMDRNLKPKAIELLTQRPQWGAILLQSIAKKKIDRSVLNINQLRKLQSEASSKPELADLLKNEYGTIRIGRNPTRDQAIAKIKSDLAKTPGNALQGEKVFQKVCGQCHKIYGNGEDVGPEITRNGRGSYDQLLSNVLDPSLVIGAAFQGTTVATTDGRVLSGLVVEESPQRIVLKMQGGKLETIARSDVDAVKKSDLSLMPEDLEKQLTPVELVDLFAYITLDRPPSDPKASSIPGAEDLPRRK